MQYVAHGNCNIKILSLKKSSSNLSQKFSVMSPVDNTLDKHQKIKMFSPVMNMGQNWFGFGTLSSYEFEKECELRFTENGPYWHVFSPEDFAIIFHNDQEFKNGVNQLALCTYNNNARLIAFELMNNHFHLILAGCKDDCIVLFNQFAGRIRRICKEITDRRVFSKLSPSFVPIENVKSLRNEIAYVHRNCMIPDPSKSPFYYLWGTGYLYFNSLTYSFQTKVLADYTINEQRQMFHSREVCLPKEMMVFDGMVSPLSFCSIYEGQIYFKNVMLYTIALFNDYESYVKIAKRDKPNMIIGYDELFYAACAVCRKEFNVNSPAKLLRDDKISLAAILHDSFNTTNAQLNRLLGIEYAILNELFPTKIKRR